MGGLRCSECTCPLCTSERTHSLCPLINAFNKTCHSCMYYASAAPRIYSVSVCRPLHAAAQYEQAREFYRLFLGLKLLQFVRVLGHARFPSLAYLHFWPTRVVAPLNVSVGVQWNPSIAATLGEQHLGRYKCIGVVFIEGGSVCSFGTWIPGRYTEVAFIQGWPPRGVPLYTL